MDICQQLFVIPRRPAMQKREEEEKDFPLIAAAKASRIKQLCLSTTAAAIATHSNVRGCSAVVARSLCM